MKLTEAKVSFFARRVMERLAKEKIASFPDEGAAFREAKRVLMERLVVEDEVDSLVRRKISGQARVVPEGGRDWDILYRKYFEEEMSRRKLD